LAREEAGALGKEGKTSAFELPMGCGLQKTLRWPPSTKGEIVLGQDLKYPVILEALADPALPFFIENFS